LGTSGGASDFIRTFFTRLAALIPAFKASRFNFSVPFGTLARTADSTAFEETMGDN
jgi:hypothetical protein